MSQKEKGFTLIELLVVIAIIGILSSVVIASLSSARMKARDARRISDLKQISLALEMYFDANGYYPPALMGGAPGPGRLDCNSSFVCFGDDTDGYDSNSIVKSVTSGDWSTLDTNLKPYLAKLPIDPINNGDPYMGANLYSYSYASVGKQTFTPGYDLYARLETPGNPAACGASSTGPIFFKSKNLCSGPQIVAYQQMYVVAH